MAITVASTPTMREILAPYRTRTNRSRPFESVPNQKVPLGATGPPLAFSPMSMNCWLGPCPTSAAITGAKIARSTITTIVPKAILAARSLRSRS